MNQNLENDDNKKEKTIGRILFLIFLSFLIIEIIIIYLIVVSIIENKDGLKNQPKISKIKNSPTEYHKKIENCLSSNQNLEEDKECRFILSDPSIVDFCLGLSSGLVDKCLYNAAIINKKAYICDYISNSEYKNKCSEDTFVSLAFAPPQP